MRRYTILTALALSSVLFACKTKKSSTQESANAEQNASVEYEDAYEDDGITMDEMIVKPDGEEKVIAVPPVYKGSETIINDISHTRLEISFDWTTQQAFGKARIEVSPYFKPVKTLVLDAQYMDIHYVGEIKGRDTTQLDYTYDSLKLTVQLKSEYKKGQSYSIFIDYTANPERVKGEGGKAIQDTKGLYFINADGKDPKVPTHLWTQGETKHNSCWIPTIDAPNEKFTHEMLMTVQDSMVTSANGRLKSSKKLANGMRVDHWVMEKQHSSYLLAMFVGNFAVFNATWNKMPLRYIVDKKYAASAKTIFKNTPEMIEFYSKRLNTPYPWPKYDQAVVHEFISGAMENTTLTIHGDMLMLDTRDLLDASYEDVIAHELFHHWFGDLVTCESWANLPLNESFATYGEYLWKEYKYGREEADYHLMNDRINYFNEASGDAKKMIRYDYEKPDDMFDRHSYQKGGLILHMLRNYLGDDAFFQGLRLYLDKFAFKTAEIHDLRQCFESITGEDLTWFFDQWFFHKGHPVLEVNHNFDASYEAYSIDVEQIQDGESPLFILPMKVSFHYGDSVHTESITIKNQKETFEFFTKRQPDWVSFDADKSTLARIREYKSFDQWLNQLRVSPLYQDRLDALRQFENADEPEQLEMALNYALADKHWNIRSEALGLINSLPPDATNAYGERIIDMALHHPKSDVRVSAFYALAKMDFSGRGNIVDQGLKDSSYAVNAAALTLMFSTDTMAAVEQAKKWCMSDKPSIKYTSLGVLSAAPGNQISIFKKVWESQEKPDFYLVYLLINSAKKSNDPQVVIDALQLMNSFEPEGDQDYLLVLFISQTNSKIQEKYQAKVDSIDARLAEEKDEAVRSALNKEKLEYLRVLEYVISN